VAAVPAVATRPPVLTGSTSKPAAATPAAPASPLLPLAARQQQQPQQQSQPPSQQAAAASALSSRILGISAKLEHRMRVRRVFTALAEEVGLPAQPLSGGGAALSPSPFSSSAASAAAAAPGPSSPGGGNASAALVRVERSDLAAALSADPDVCVFPEYEGRLGRLHARAAGR
jgi:hypothetical protein